MEMAHALDLSGCLDVLTDVLGPRPLLEPNQVAWLGVEDGPATEWERQEARRLGLHVTSSDDLHSIRPSLPSIPGDLPRGPLAVHVDVDVLDFTDSPLAENTDGRNTGPRWTRLRTHLRSQPETSAFGPCRSENSIRPEARGIPMRFPVSSPPLQESWPALTVSPPDGSTIRHSRQQFSSLTGAVLVAPTLTARLRTVPNRRPRAASCLRPSHPAAPRCHPRHRQCEGSLLRMPPGRTRPQYSPRTLPVRSPVPRYSLLVGCGGAFSRAPSPPCWPRRGGSGDTE